MRQVRGCEHKASADGGCATIALTWPGDCAMPSRTPPAAGAALFALPPLCRGFYDRDPRQVAPALLGKLLIHGRAAGRIVETEAYLAAGDPAAHAFRGRTPRTEVLYGPPGHAYVYRTRQHCCLNVAVQAPGVPGCVLIRAVQPVAGLAAMRRRRSGVVDARLVDGPAKLCQALGVGMAHYGQDLCASGGLRIVADGAAGGRVVNTVRVGVTKARDWPLRYVLAMS